MGPAVLNGIRPLGEPLLQALLQIESAVIGPKSYSRIVLHRDRNTPLIGAARRESY